MTKRSIDDLVEDLYNSKDDLVQTHSKDGVVYYKPTYRLPTVPRTTTQDQEEYGTAWVSLARKVEAFFPGYELSAFDPDIRFEKRMILENNTYRVEDSFSLSVAAALLLTSK